jgi:acetoacetyl-CoA synthetase
VGAVFSSSSTDMGVKGILQRAVQVNPKVSFWEVGWAVRGHADGRVVAVYGRRGAV